jgi:hypothetical protein
MTTTEQVPHEDRSVEDGHPKTTDNTAAKGLLGTIFILLVVCSVIAAVIYTYTRKDANVPGTELPAP